MSKHDEESNHRTLDEQRRKETLDHYIEEVMKENTSRSFSAAKKLAKKRLAKDSKSNPHYEKVFLRTAPSSRAIPRKGISEIAEIRAMMALPEVAWIKEHLESSGSSRNGEWGLPASVLLKMTYFGRPDFSNTRRHFIPGSAVDWAYGHVKGPATQAGEYFALQTILNRHKPGSAIHVNLRLLKRFVDAKVPGTDRPAYPNAFKRCSVDGTLIQANISQTPTYAPTKRQRKRLERQAAGPRRPMVQGVWHAKGTGAEPSDDPINVSGTRKSCVGYNLVVITCMDTGDPVIWQLMPATGNERTAVVEMLEALYILWPDFPMEYLVGDALYGNSRDFIAHLYERYGVHAVFPVHGNMSKRTSDSVDGVPLCQHGPMNLVKTGEVWDSVKRRKEGVKPGHLPPNGKGSRPRLRWECPEDICAGAKTYLHKDWHLNTFLPHGGNSEKAALRAALLARRNHSESLFSQMKNAGIGSNWPGRARWADDNGMRWGLSLALMQFSARRVAHLSGAYYRALVDTAERNYLTTVEKRNLRLQGPPPDRWAIEIMGEGTAVPPSTIGIEADLPIDREYLLPSLMEFSDRPDRPKASREDEPPAAGMAKAA